MGDVVLLRGTMTSSRIKDLSFERLVELMDDRLNFRAFHHIDQVPSHDFDDLKQELMIELWNKLDRIPDNIMQLPLYEGNKLDYRFTKYVDRMFYRRIIGLRRELLYDYHDPLAKYRDCLNYAVPLVDNFDEMLDI